MEKSLLDSLLFEVKFATPEILYLLELVQADVAYCREHSTPSDRLSLRDRQEIERKLHEAWSTYPQPYGLFYLRLLAGTAAHRRGADDNPPATTEPGEG